jgi:hypothetical protein
VRSSEIIPEQTRTKLKISTLIALAEGETILWHRNLTHGIIHKEITVEEAITNKRCLKFDANNKRIISQVGIANMPEVVIMNIHRINDSLGGGIFLTPRMLGLPWLPFGAYGGPRRGNLKIFGDVSLMINGNVVMTFENIKDPQGMRQLIQALKRERSRHFWQWKRGPDQAPRGLDTSAGPDAMQKATNIV